jgi:hypothetical protein
VAALSLETRTITHTTDEMRQLSVADAGDVRRQVGVTTATELKINVRENKFIPIGQWSM